MPDTVGAVAKALKILCQFDASTPALSVSQVSRRLEIPKSTAHNLLRTLEAFDFLHQDPADRRYRLGPRLFELSRLFCHHTPLLAAARPHLERLAAETHETVKLGVLSEDEVLILAAVESPYQLHTRGDEGKRAPLHCTGLGKAILAVLPGEQVRQIAARWGLPKYTARTITALEALEKELAQIRSRGYALDWEENEEGVVCVAAPIPDPQGGLWASISVSAPISRMTRPRVVRMAAQVMVAARAVAAALGGADGRGRTRKSKL
ncbi:MAG: IclR family transcriptional regulator [Bryobacteraceae bacterium]